MHWKVSTSLLQYVESDKDLGILINSSFDFNGHIDAIISKSNQQFGLLRRAGHFIYDFNRRRALYLTLVRSQFEDCYPVWRPGKTNLDKFDSFLPNSLALE